MFLQWMVNIHCTCRGQGLKHKGYHGYRIHNPGEDPQENLCACCDLTCGACRTFARRKLQSLQWTIPLKMPPVDIGYKHKPPPPKRTLHFKPDEGLDCIPLLFFHGFFSPFCIAGYAAVSSQDGGKADEGMDWF